MQEAIAPYSLESLFQCLIAVAAFMIPATLIVRNPDRKQKFMVRWMAILSGAIHLFAPHPTSNLLVFAAMEALMNVPLAFVIRYLLRDKSAGPQPPSDPPKEP